MSEERLQKILARAGVASRRKVEELIREARVTINGRAAEIGDKADLERDAVKVDGKRIQSLQGSHRYLLLNKPKGVMSTLSDPEGRPTVLDLVPPPLRKALVAVGRLDFNTEGLLLLTDDGELALRVAHPRYGSVKLYEVKVKGRPTEAEIAHLEAGVVLDGRRTAPSTIRPRPVPRRHEDMENSWWTVELTEGRTRQIREMFHRIGHSVQKLRRIGIGPISDPDLPVGGLRDLTEREVEALRRSARAPEEKGGRKAPARNAAPARVRAPKPAAKPGASRVDADAPREGAAPKGPKGASRVAPKGAPKGASRVAKPGSRAGASRVVRPAAGPGRRAEPGASRSAKPGARAGARPVTRPGASRTAKPARPGSAKKGPARPGGKAPGGRPRRGR
jgi:23S rRNA pseudouridine2605 synthase